VAETFNPKSVAGGEDEESPQVGLAFFNSCRGRHARRGCTPRLGGHTRTATRFRKQGRNRSSILGVHRDAQDCLWESDESQAKEGLGKGSAVRRFVRELKPLIMRKRRIGKKHMTKKKEPRDQTLPPAQKSRLHRGQQHSSE